MDEKTEKLLRELAQKLGTTAEYLWTVLLNQAKYSAIISAIQMAIMVAIIFYTIILHIRFSKKDSIGWSQYDKKPELLIMPMMLAGAADVIMLIMFMVGINEVMTAIFNPEYWALQRIFDMK